MSLILGITGHRGVGKSLALSFLEDQGFFTVNADDVVADLYDDSAVEAISHAFGNHVIDEGRVNKKALKALILKNPDTLETLNSLIHPLVCAEIKKIIAGKDYVVIEAVYFRKGQLLNLVDYLIFVEGKLLKEDPFYSYLNNFYAQNADSINFTIVNDTTIEHLRTGLVEILTQLEYKR